MNDHNNIGDENQAKDEETIKRLLQAAGRRAEIPEDTKRIWEETFRRELGVAVQKRRWRFRTITGALCATVLLAIFYWAVPMQQSATHAQIARITDIAGSGFASIGAQQQQRLQPGSSVTPATLLQTPEKSRLAIDYANASVRLNEHTRIRVFKDYIELLSGQIYIDNNNNNLSSIRVKTSIAEIRDIGTQFSVSYSAEGLTTMVREGEILVDFGRDEYKATAKADFAQSISISNNREVSKSRARKQGDEWDWILEVASPFAIEGRTAYDFLQWSARETGLRLDFDDHRAQLHAQRTILHGDVSTLNPNTAIEVVLATTRLTADRSEDGRLRILLSERNDNPYRRNKG